MAKWRKAAIDHLPDLRDTIAHADTLMALWIDLRLAFEKAYREPTNEDLIARIYTYATWCLGAPRHGDAGRDPTTAVTAAFYEHIPQSKAARDDMPRWFTPDQVAALRPVFSYHIGEKAFDDLLAYTKHHATRHVSRRAPTT
jgi:hypothetical protein